MAVLMPVVFGVNAPSAQNEQKVELLKVRVSVGKRAVPLGVPMPGGVSAGRLVMPS